MKKTIAYLFAALAIVSVASCTKAAPQIAGDESCYGKIITCTFAANDNVTKTSTTDGKTPLWVAGDQIRVYDEGDYSKTAEITLVASGTTPGENQGVLSADCKSFTFAKPSGWTGALCAIYPASAFLEFWDNAVINFEGQDGTFAKANICAGKEDAGTVSFKNVGAILKFTSKPATVTDVFIPIEGLKDYYSVSYTGTTPVLTDDYPSTFNRSFSVGSGEEAIYIGVPAGTVAQGATFLYTDSDKNILGSKSTSNSNAITANKLYSLGDIQTGTIPAGFIKYAFSVSSSKKVYFSKGNLFYDGSDFQFEDDQYSSATSWSTFHVSHFFWSKNASVAYASTYSDSADEYDHFFTNDNNYTPLKPKSDFTVNGATGLWCTMSGGSSGEWNYLLSTRIVNGGTGEGYSYQLATINSDEIGVYGMIIYPDGYTSQTTATSYTASQWATMESAGCVFLLAAGQRENSSISKFGTYGCYWSSRANSSSNSYCLNFFNGSVYPTSGSDRNKGFSVRLVTAAQ